MADRKERKSIVLNNDIQEVPLLAAFIEEVCEEAGTDAVTTMQMNLAMEEAVVNVMNYAYPKGEKGEIDIEATTENERLTFVITDSGTPFDPTAKEDADTTLSAEERPIGGLGIFLVKQLMDSVGYERKEGKNVLTMRKSVIRNI